MNESMSSTSPSCVTMMRGFAGAAATAEGAAAAARGAAPAAAGSADVVRGRAVTAATARTAPRVALRRKEGSGLIVGLRLLLKEVGTAAGVAVVAEEPPLAADPSRLNRPDEHLQATHLRLRVPGEARRIRPDLAS